MSIESQLLVSMASAIAGGLIGAIVGALVTWKATKNSIASQEKTARESWLAQELILINDSRARWISERLEKLVAGIWSIHDLAGPYAPTRTDAQSWMTNHINEAKAAQTGLILEPSAIPIVTSFQELDAAFGKLLTLRNDNPEYQEPQKMYDDAVRIANMCESLQEQIAAYADSLRKPMIR